MHVRTLFQYDQTRTFANSGGGSGETHWLFRRVLHEGSLRHQPLDPTEHLDELANVTAAGSSSPTLVALDTQTSVRCKTPHVNLTVMSAAASTLTMFKMLWSPRCRHAQRQVGGNINSVPTTRCTVPPARLPCSAPHFAEIIAPVFNHHCCLACPTVGIPRPIMMGQQRPKGNQQHGAWTSVLLVAPLQSSRRTKHGR